MNGNRKGRSRSNQLPSGIMAPTTDGPASQARFPSEYRRAQPDVATDGPDGWRTGRPRQLEESVPIVATERGGCVDPISIDCVERRGRPVVGVEAHYVRHRPSVAATDREAYREGCEVVSGPDMLADTAGLVLGIWRHGGTSVVGACGELDGIVVARDRRTRGFRVQGLLVLRLLLKKSMGSRTGQSGPRRSCPS